MKIRRTIALVVAFAMIAAIVPAFGLTAFADVTGIVMSDGKTAYAVTSSNLIADGSFETDAWEAQLTTGVFDRQNAGQSDLGIMNQDSRMLGRGFTAFERVTPGSDGNYAIVAVTDDITNNEIPRPTNGANGPTSIKHYILNDGSAAQKYYVSFSAKAAGDDAAFSYVIEGVTAGGVLDDGTIPSGTQVTVTSDGYTVVDAAVDVTAGNYLLINVYNMAANAVYLDDFKVYKIEESADSKSFTQAMSQWETVFPYKDGQTVSSDITLPSSVGTATVTWESSNESVISKTGKYTASANDTTVVLTATITAGSFTAQKVCTLKARGFGNSLVDALRATVPGSVTDDIELVSTVPGYEGSTVAWVSSNPAVIGNDGKYTAPADRTKVTLTATVAYSGASFEEKIDVVAGVLNTLVPNGGFENTGSDALNGWTNRLGGSITDAEIVYDSTIGANVLSIPGGTGGKSATNSVGTTWAIESGKLYTLAFDFYCSTMDPVYNKVTADVGTADDGTATDVGSNVLINYGAEMTAGQWNHFETTFTATTDTVYFQSSWTKDFKLANVVLKELKTDFETNVTINYIDRETNTKIKDSRVVEGVAGANDGSMSYSAVSADKEDIEYQGNSYYYDAESIDSVALKPEGNVINLYFKQYSDGNNLIKNGDFSVIVDDKIPGWTVGGADGIDGVAQMTTANFEYVTEADNSYIKSKGGNQSLSGTSSIKKFVALEPGKVYSLSFNIKRASGDAPAETWIGAALVKADGLEIRENNTDHERIVELRNLYGSIIPEKDGTDMFFISAADGWHTVSTTLTPDEEYNVLLISAKWLDSNWCFDDFLLEEVKSEFTGTVTINYLEKGTGTVLKPASQIADQFGGITYRATSEDKADIEYNGATYFYDTESVDSVVIEKETGNIINLYFNKLEAVSADNVSVDTTVGEGAKLPATVNVTYNNGTTKAAAVAWENVPELTEGAVVTVKGTVEGLEITATINVFYGADLPDNYDEYDWVGEGTKYPVVKGSENLIANGSFEDGTKTGWTSYNNGEKELGSNWFVTEEQAKDGTKSVKVVQNGGWTGSNNDNNLQTYFPVENGKIYYLSFSEYWTSAQASSGEGHMSAAVASEGFGTSNHKKEYGGWSSWYPDGNRTFAREAGKWLDYVYVIDLTNANLTTPMITVAYSLNSCDGLYLD
ncbi:MAG: immunoglobulin-like domain-containing protein, partial [Clostridia bacterium]